jgi:hypothetical protein
MPGSNRIAKPGEPACGAPTEDGPCQRPAGLGTDHVGTGVCLRHSKPHSTFTKRKHPMPSPRSKPKPERPQPTRRVVVYLGDPLEHVREHLAIARHAAEPFPVSWAAAVDGALGIVPPEEAGEWSDVLNGTQPAWRDAYERPTRRTRLAELTADPA